MSMTPDPWWPQALLAAVVLGDALLSLRPPGFIRGCLTAVGFPEDWWWTLIVIKVLAGAGLITGIQVAGLGAAANVGVVCYFLAAVYAHIRVRFLGSEFWINCLGMLSLSTATLVLSFGPGI